MPQWAVRCTQCGNWFNYIWQTALDRDVDLKHGYIVCRDRACMGQLEVVPAAPNFTIKGYSAKNGYSK